MSDDEPMEPDMRTDAAEPGVAAEIPEAGAEARAAELQERLLRVQAELENFRKRSRREYDDAQRYREIDVLRDLLPVLDNVLRAIEASEKTADVDALRSGFRMTAQQLEKLLGSHGCQTIETDGAAFDPAVHDAILQQEVPGVAPGTVVATASRGYRLHDRVVRPAQVIVAKGG
ncbi:MAG: nucleotide exchange factor GrpE [Planctomycetaceae bacterium]